MKKKLLIKVKDGDDDKAFNEVLPIMAKAGLAMPEQMDIQDKLYLLERFQFYFFINRNRSNIRINIGDIVKFLNEEDNIERFLDYKFNQPDKSNGKILQPY